VGHKGRLARTVWPEKAEELALGDREADVIDRHEIAVVFI